MKNFYFIAFIFIGVLNVSAQETVQKRNRITDSVIERFSVLKTNKDVKEGLYQAFFQRKTLLAFGNYSNNKRNGTWNFYKPNGLLVQTYDFDKNVIIFESPRDTLADIKYMVDEKLKPTDSLTRPVKIGGIYYGFLPYLTIFQLPFDTMGVNMDDFDAYVELLISPLGRLADYKVRLISANYQYDRTFSLDVHLFAAEDQQFLPVTLNDKPILSRVIIHCYIASDGTINYN